MGLKSPEGPKKSKTYDSRISCHRMKGLRNQWRARCQVPCTSIWTSAAASIVILQSKWPASCPSTSPTSRKLIFSTFRNRRKNKKTLRTKKRRGKTAPISCLHKWLENRRISRKETGLLEPKLTVDAGKIMNNHLRRSQSLKQHRSFKQLKSKRPLTSWSMKPPNLSKCAL